MDRNNQNLEALQVENSRTEEDHNRQNVEDHEDQNDNDEDDEEFDDERQQSELERSLSPIGAELGNSQSETLGVPPSYLLSEVPVEYTLQPHKSPELKNLVNGSHQEVLTSVIAQADQDHLQNLLELPGHQSASSKSSPTSAAQSMSSAPSPTVQYQNLSPVAKSNSMCVAVVDQQNNSDSKTVSALPIVKTPFTDRYNWRKYGQKQVKSPQGSRSYYKCTHAECYAKRIECCDHSNCVIEIIYKGQHNHDPPSKVNCTRERKLALSVEPVVGDNNATHPIEALTDTDLSTSIVLIQEAPIIPEMKQKNLSGSDGNAQFSMNEEHVDEPEPKRRVKKNGSAYSGSFLKTGKKPKFVVHAAGDVGISGDGYRWRKYGQKMVKGNPHPRNYYRCTSAGCPVRKHIERDVDSTTGVVITYKGVHDHDMPVQKKRHGPPSGPLGAPAAPAPVNNLQIMKTEAFPNHVSMTQWSVDTEGGLTGEALNHGGDKALESARTLLGIGFEIKPC